jgi:hypothetical protein
MRMDLADTIDAALEQLQAGIPIPDILTHQPAHAEALGPLLDTVSSLDALRPVEMPTAEELLSDRNRFLSEITVAQIQPVSPGPLVRLGGWIAQRLPWRLTGTNKRRPKEGYRMSAILVKLILVLGMVVGSAGGTAALANNSLPDSPLYPAKLALEQLRLHAASGSVEEAEVHMNLAQNRVQEMMRLALADRVPGEATLLRLQTHLNQAFQLAAGLSDEEMQGTLTRARQMLQTQEQVMLQTQNQAHGAAQEPLGQALGLLRQARHQAETGLQEPQTFRWRYAHGSEAEPPGPGSPGGNPDCPSEDCEPAGEQYQNQHGPQPESPGPGGPGGNPEPPCTDCEPTGEQNQNGPQPEQPGPGGPGGNPDPPCTDCEPAGEQNGPQPEQPGPGGPGGNPDPPCTDCEPAGEQNGPQPEDPGPGTPGGNPDPPCTDCEPAGEQNGPQPEPPGPGDSGGDSGSPCTDCEPAGEGQKGGKP